MSEIQFSIKGPEEEVMHLLKAMVNGSREKISIQGQEENVKLVLNSTADEEQATHAELGTLSTIEPETAAKHEPLPDQEPPVDTKKLRASMRKLFTIKQNEGVDIRSILVNVGGAAKFSDVPDDKLQELKAAVESAKA